MNSLEARVQRKATKTYNGAIYEHNKDKVKNLEAKDKLLQQPPK